MPTPFHIVDPPQSDRSAMGKLTELRGALGGGIAAIAWGAGAVPSNTVGRRIRCVQEKRQVLSDELIRRYMAAGRLGRGTVTVAAVAHTRYPTSSRR